MIRLGNRVAARLIYLSADSRPMHSRFLWVIGIPFPIINIIWLATGHL